MLVSPWTRGHAGIVAIVYYWFSSAYMSQLRFVGCVFSCWMRSCPSAHAKCNPQHKQTQRKCFEHVPFVIFDVASALQLFCLCCCMFVYETRKPAPRSQICNPNQWKQTQTKTCENASYDFVVVFCVLCCLWDGLSNDYVCVAVYIERYKLGC
jgi:hypothetical protein